jgi:hypothetical protein
MNYKKKLRPPSARPRKDPPMEPFKNKNKKQMNIAERFIFSKLKVKRQNR